MIEKAFVIHNVGEEPVVLVVRLPGERVWTTVPSGGELHADSVEIPARVRIVKREGRRVEVSAA